jgi:hypothetical protein
MDFATKKYSFLACLELVRKGGFEKPFKRTLKDLQGTWTLCNAAKPA